MDFVQELISRYYKDANIEVDAIANREFGFGSKEKKIETRHYAFPNIDSLRKFLVENAPYYVSYSTSYYKYPSARPMEKKERFATELVFDLDVTDMNLSCQKIHGKDWVCENCLYEVKREAIKLVEDFLINDFGFSKDEIEINFSGYRGYHIHVKSKEALELDQEARKEISDYITANNLDFDKIFYIKNGRLVGPKPNDFGWYSKIAKSILDALQDYNKLVSLGINPRIAKKLYEKKELVEMGIKNGNWDMVAISKKEEFWKRLISNLSIKQSDKIDANVTIDPTHLIRMPNTIHGGSGLIAKKFSFNEIDKFDPMKDAIAFKDGDLRVYANTKFPLIMNDETFGPYNGEEVTIPKYAALYLYLKGLAEIKN